MIGGGPAGLMAAEMLAEHGISVDLYDAMPSAGRKFLMAGRGGLNITHTDPPEKFLARYGARAPRIAPLLAGFGPDELRAWVHRLGIKTFVGTSGRVFPAEMKAAPLLRAWLHRLRGAGVRFHMRHRWQGLEQADHGIRLSFATPEGDKEARADVVVLALGGGSWPKLGADAAWLPVLQSLGIAIAPLRPANCGFDTDWSEHFRTRFAGQPVKRVAIDGRQGEFVVTAAGVEGSLVYALSAGLRDAIEAEGSVTVALDLVPEREPARLAEALSRPRGNASLANHLRKTIGLTGAKAGLLRELAKPEDLASPARIAKAIKSLPLRLLRPRPLAEAISTAGGVAFEALDERLMLRALPGVFCAGEMLDWEAPTGGYLLTACFAGGRAAGLGAAAWLGRQARPSSRSSMNSSARL
ncbi:NAD(P)/FAD-dependent oxidoreductase [Desertibaculum subflavum]|uniref:NAD(P)/FAD-dependent oxidoreductase n=1 Tax=Desertibaculum subflavum TaxID=2268458 RepID=UPI0034D37345